MQVHEPIASVNVYEFLQNPEVQDANSNGGTISEQHDFVSARVGLWDNIIDMRTCLQNMLQK
jgi:DNA-directed RNA polymerase-4 subunit 1